jgi:predicted RND superfamily exporter protein
MPRFAAWVAFIERRHRMLLAGSLVLTLVSALSLLALRFDFDVLGMLPTGAPAFDNFKTFVADFGELDELIVLIEGPSPATLTAFADAFTERLRGLDGVTAVQGKIDVEQIQQGLLGASLYNYVPVDAYDSLADRLTPAGIDAQVATDRAILQAPFDFSAVQMVRRDPLGLTRLAAQALGGAFDTATLNVQGGYPSTRDGTALLVLVRPARSAFDLPFTTELMHAVRQVEAAARAATPEAQAVRVGYTGSYAFALEDAATLKWDVGRYTLLALVGVLAVFYAGYRNLRILPFVTYPLLLSTALTFAASLLCYAQLNAVSISFAAILYGLSIDSGIYYYTRLAQELREHDLRTAVRRTLAGLGGANVVASTTTAAAFFVIGFSRLAGISQLGWLTAIGMLISIAEFFLLYPALSFWVPRISLVEAQLETPRLGRLAAACAAHARIVLSAVAVATVGLVWLASGVRFDVDLTHLRPAQTAASQVQDTIAARFGANVEAGAVLVRGDDLQQALEVSEAVAAQLGTYRAQNLVASLRSVTALLPSERTQRERLSRFNALPRAQILETLRASLIQHGFVPAQFDVFFETFAAPRDTLVRLGDTALAPFGPVIAHHVRQRGAEFTVATYVEPAPGVDLATIADRLHRDLPQFAFMVAGRALLQDELHHLLHRELIGFGVAAFALNLVLVLLNFPHLGTALALLIPEALVIACCLAFMRVTGVGIDPVNLIVVPLILGIGVDDCVYVAARYQSGEPIGAALRYGGKSLAIASLTIMTGFGFLGLSHYPALAGMGTFAAASLLLCLVASVTLLPALLAVLGRRMIVEDG